MSRARRNHAPLLLLAAATALVTMVSAAGAARVRSTSRVSVSDAGRQADDDSYSASISGDGRYVAFYSEATNLVANDSNAASDVFVRDRSGGRTERVSVDSAGGQANGASARPSISRNGQRVAFESDAADLVAGDNNGDADVFVRDRGDDETTRVSVSLVGGNPNNHSGGASISRNGRFVAFESYATNLVAGDTNGVADVFVRDLESGTTARVSLRSNGAQGDTASYDPAISGSGRYVVFESEATNLVRGDVNGDSDIFVHDRRTGRTRRASIRSDGRAVNGDSSDPAISGNGSRVAFVSVSSHLVGRDTNRVSDVFVRDLRAKTTRRVTVSTSDEQANGWSYSPAISADGRHVAFESYGAMLVSGSIVGVGNIFVRDLVAEKTRLVSVGDDGSMADDDLRSPSLSTDGRFVAFDGFATNLVRNDRNGARDVFVRRRR